MKLTEDGVDITEVVRHTADQTRGEVRESMSDQLAIELDVVFTKRYSESRNLVYQRDSKRDSLKE